MDPSNSPANISRAVALLQEVRGFLSEFSPEAQPQRSPVAGASGVNTAQIIQNDHSRPSFQRAGPSSVDRNISFQPAPSTSRNLTIADSISGLATFRHMLPSFRQNTTSEVNNEVSRAFEPYDPSDRQIRQRRSLVGCPVKLKSKICYALAGPGDTRTPGTLRKLKLEGAGLGEKVLQLPLGSSSEQVTAAVHQLFPSLEGKPFEVLKSVGGGDYRPFVKLSAEEPVPKLSNILLLAGRCKVYVRPIGESVMIEEEIGPGINDGIEASGALSTNQDSLESTISTADTNAINFEAPRTPSRVGALAVNIVEEFNGSVRSSGSEGDAIVNSSSNEISIISTHTMESEVPTMEDFRREAYLKHPGTQTVYVQRDDFAMGVLGDPVFDLCMKPQVIFAGELGNDVGALQKEFFSLGIQTLSQGKFNGRLPFFEGKDDHKLPSFDASLLRAGIYKQLGKFMAHSAIHSGVAFVGLSQAVVEYLTTQDVDSDSPITIRIDDIPDYDKQQIIRNMDIAIGNPGPVAISIELIAEFHRLAEESGFNEEVDREKYNYMREHVLYHNVIEKRRPALEAIKLAFRETELLSFLEGKSYILQGLFPFVRDISYNLDMILNKIEFNESSDHHKSVKTFIEEECKETVQIRALLSAWTGWSMPPEQKLTIEVVDFGQFCFHSCFHQLEIPESFTKEDIYNYLRLTIGYGYAGFGAV